MKEEELYPSLIASYRKRDISVRNPSDEQRGYWRETVNEVQIWKKSGMLGMDSENSRQTDVQRYIKWALTGHAFLVPAVLGIVLAR